MQVWLLSYELKLTINMMDQCFDVGLYRSVSELENQTCERIIGDDPKTTAWRCVLEVAH